MYLRDVNRRVSRVCIFGGCLYYYYVLACIFPRMPMSPRLSEVMYLTLESLWGGQRNCTAVYYILL